MSETTTLRVRLLRMAGSFWWILIPLAVAGAWFADIPIFQYALWVIGIPILLMIALPILVYAFAPLIGLFLGLKENFSDSSDATVARRWFWVPLSLLAVTAFTFAQILLVIWSFGIAVAVWANTIGTTVTLIAMLFFGLAPVGMLLAPFVVWYQSGFFAFTGIAIMFVYTLLWPVFGMMAFNDDGETTVEGLLGYSPHLFLLGALASQMLAMMAFTLEYNAVGDPLARIVGPAFLLLALIAAIQWMFYKRKLSATDRAELYRPSVWIYVLGFFITNGLYARFESFEADRATLLWLNLFFICGLISRLASSIRRRMRRVVVIDTSEV